jgi:ClpP class serine protease
MQVFVDGAGTVTATGAGARTVNELVIGGGAGNSTLVLADMSRKAQAQVQAFVTELLAESGQMSADKAAQTGKALTEGRWTHDFPITAKAARELGLKVNTDMPKDVYSLMDLYPQAPGKRPTVLYVEPPGGMRETGPGEAPAPPRPEPRK